MKKIHYYSKLFTSLLSLAAGHVEGRALRPHEVGDREAAGADQELGVAAACVLVQVEISAPNRKIGKLLQIFGGLVLGCIDADFCK